MSKIYILHENEKWIGSLLELLEKRQINFESWLIDQGINGKPVDFATEPPEGVFFNRVSCSSHNRGKCYSVGFAFQILHWLESHNRIVINGSRSFNLEVSKTVQYIEMVKNKILTPITISCTHPQTIENAFRYMVGDNLNGLIVKDNQGGSGCGVYRIENLNHLKSHLEEKSYPLSPDNITLVQQYIESPDQKITRVEIIGGEYVYSLSVDIRDGFNLCPADSCNIQTNPYEKFVIFKDENNPLIEKYIKFAKDHSIDIVAFEYVTDCNGDRWTYDINCNTNYNADAEEKWGHKHYALEKLIEYLCSRLK